MTTDDRLADLIPEPGPHAVRVTLGPASAHADLPPRVVEPGDGDLRDLGGGRVDVQGAAGPDRRVILEPPEAIADGRGVVRREVVVDGWRVEVEIESARRAVLRERASRGRSEAAHGGPTEVRAIIPGRVVSVSVAAGDAVAAGQQVLVVEAMKMQNELRAPRDGTIARVSVAAGETIEIGDLLLVLE